MSAFNLRERKIIKFFKEYDDRMALQKRDILLYIDEKPYSWNVVYQELIHQTALSKRMIEEWKKI